MKQTRQRNIFIFFCVAPAIILFFIFMIYPTFEVFRMSLYNWGGLSNNQEFVGFQNFKILWDDMNFFRTFQNTVLLIVFVSLITIVLALLFASLLTRETLKGNNFFRIIFYIPNILSIVVIAGIFSAIYEPKNGLLNSIFQVFSFDNLQQLWLGDQKIVIYSVALALVWQAIGYYMVMYMSGMSAIPTSFYEAAKLDGAGRIAQFFQITLPLVWNNLRTTLTFFIISTINLSFQLVKVMTSGGPDGASEVFLSYMYKQAYTNSVYGYGMAVGVVIFIFSFVLSAVVSKVTKREPLQF